MIWTSRKRSGLTIIRFKETSARFVERFRKVHSIERENFQKNTRGPGRDWQRSHDYQARSCMARSMDVKWVKPLRMKRNRNGQKKNRSSTKLQDRGIYFIDPDDKTQKFSQMRWRKLERPMAPAMPCKRQTSIVKVNAKPKIGNARSSKQCKVVKWNLMNRRGNERYHCNPKFTKIGLQEKDFLYDSVKIWVHKFIPMPQAMKIPDAKMQWTRSGRSSTQFQRGFWKKKSRARRRLFWKYKETKKKSTFLHGSTYIISRMRS